jgi:hypothetical protein
MAATQRGDPVIFLVLKESRNRLFHPVIAAYIPESVSFAVTAAP